MSDRCPRHPDAPLRKAGSNLGPVLLCTAMGCTWLRLVKGAGTEHGGRRAKQSADQEETLTDRLLGQLRLLRVPAPVKEYPYKEFLPGSRCAADLAWPDLRLLVEIEGGIFIQGRHTRGKGYRRDCQKYNAAAKAGYAVLRYTSPDIRNGQAAQDIAAEVLRRCDPNSIIRDATS